MRKYMTKRTIVFLFLFLNLSVCLNKAYGINIDGKGHYALVGETRTHPGFDPAAGYFEAINQYFRLNTEIRSGDQTSFFVEFSLFDKPRQAYLGDMSEPRECSPIAIDTDGLQRPANRGNADNCVGRNQNITEPGYQPYIPKISKAYAQYAFDYCLLTVGRRDRGWGLGALHSKAEGIFDTSASIYDGVTCDINITKTQTLGFSVGYDKITETGRAAWLGADTEVYGATRKADDVDQFFFTIEYDDRKANAGSVLARQIGIYFANLTSGSDLKTDVKIADLYLSFFMPNLVIKQEIIFRLGKSADPNFTRLGGKSSMEDEIITNNVQATAATGNIEYTLASSGSYVGPVEFHQGTFRSHSLFFDYAYAPGDSDGYLDEASGGLGMDRDNEAGAIAFNPNFKPALLFFNGHPESARLRVDGIFDPSRVMNALVLGIGYRYKSLERGNFEVALINARLNQKMSSSIRDLYAATEVKPVGYYGSNLGYEVDLKYSRRLGRNIEWGLAGAIGLPGKAWKTRDDQGTPPNLMVQGYGALHF